MFDYILHSLFSNIPLTHSYCLHRHFSTDAQKSQKRKSSIEGKALATIESTPLRDMGEAGPPQIVDMFDCYSVSEGLILILFAVTRARLPTNISTFCLF